MNLRPYQTAAVASALDALDRGESPVLQLPTGAGKSLVAAELCRELLHRGFRSVLLCTHVKELVSQDAATIARWIGEDQVGVCSAGLRRFELDRPVTVASIQTLASKKRLPTIPIPDLVIVDEAHLVSPRETSRYALLSARIGSVPWVGLSATPWRLDGGWITEIDGIPFTDVAFEVGIGDLIASNHLSPVVSYAKSDSIRVETVRNGEFVTEEQVGLAMDLVGVHAEQIVDAGSDRRSWLVFAASVRHAQALSEAITALGTISHTVSQETPADERERLVSGHRDGSIRCLVSVGVLTTGFDSPGTDLVVLCRATASSALFVQMVGRGLRTAPGKTDCRVIDFGGNFVRHGPIDSPLIGCHGTATTEVRAKVCPECDGVVALRDTVCHLCGAEIPKLPRADATLTARSTGRAPIVVADVHVSPVVTKAGDPALRITYLDRSGCQIGSEWGFPAGPERWKRGAWAALWRDRGGEEPVPRTVPEAVERWGEEIGVPVSIVATPGKFPGSLGSVRWGSVRRTARPA